MDPNANTTQTTGMVGTATDAASSTSSSTSAAAAPTHEEHASVLHTIFADLEKVLGLVTNPAVVALLPAKFQAYAAAAAIVDQVVTAK